MDNRLIENSHAKTITKRKRRRPRPITVVLVAVIIVMGLVLAFAAALIVKLNRFNMFSRSILLENNYFMSDQYKGKYLEHTAETQNDEEIDVYDAEEYYYDDFFALMLEFADCIIDDAGIGNDAGIREQIAEMAFDVFNTFGFEKRGVTEFVYQMNRCYGNDLGDEATLRGAAYEFSIFRAARFTK